MSVGATMRACRKASGLTLRELAERAGTSHATLAAYEAGRKVPGGETLRRVLRCTGFDLTIGPYAIEIDAGHRTRGEELEEVLELAELLPTRHSPTLDAPIFGRP